MSTFFRLTGLGAIVLGIATGVWGDLGVGLGMIAMGMSFINTASIRDLETDITTEGESMNTYVTNRTHVYGPLTEEQAQEIYSYFQGLSGVPEIVTQGAAYPEAKSWESFVARQKTLDRVLQGIVDKDNLNSLKEEKI